MKIAGNNYRIEGVFRNFMTVPDCFVTVSNKLGHGHGEAKLYVSSKEAMYDFYGRPGFSVKCFMLKSDLLNYMEAIKIEYYNPSQNYRDKNDLKDLWQKRVEHIKGMPEIIEFTIYDQVGIAGPRGYISSRDAAYQIIRDISLPLVSYISVMKLKDAMGSVLFYWKLFVDFDAIFMKEHAPLVLNYGKAIQNKEGLVREHNNARAKEIAYARVGQGKYREALLAECPFCPITRIADERLLIASHIKPWCVSDDLEKIDPKNGFMLSPLFDKLFDKGFITFTDDRHLITSEWISPNNWKCMGVKNNTFINALPLDDERKRYLEFHRNSIFHGVIE